MTNSPFTPGIASGRLDAEALDQNFADLHRPLDDHEALVAADRCYFCHDAPCITACPTSIDIPLFIRQIATGTPEAAAKTIFDQNILGGMCARVCPTETLCEEACVREAAEGKPVLIGQLQRYATDTLMEAGVHPYARAAATGQEGRRGRARGPRVWPARIGWRCMAMTSPSSRRAPRAAASTNTASPTTRPWAVSPGQRSTGS
jgi:dihydropyrimidine dehydrogenase (NAD+) subunit PreT